MRLEKIEWWSNFIKYYQAAQLAHLAQYPTVTGSPLWLILEAAECDPLVVDNLLWLHPKERKTITNSITQHYLAIWDCLKLSCCPHSPSVFFE